jgi:hypothetical protein
VIPATERCTHGLEEAAGVGYLTRGVDAGSVHRDSPVVIRYADDLLALCHTREQANRSARLAEWLMPRAGVQRGQDAHHQRRPGM